MADVPIDPIGAARRLDTILGRGDLPYTDEDGDTLLIASGLIEMHKGNRVASMRVPTGEDAARMAHMLLTVGEMGGHMVIARAQVDRLIRAEAVKVAQSMRERAAVCAEDDPTADYDIKRQILALPLLPTATEDTDSTVHVATPEGITPCGRGHHDVTVTDLIREATCLVCLRTLAQAPQDDLTEASEVERLTRDRDRLRTAWESARRRARQQRDALREGLIADLDQVRVTRDRYRTERDEARRYVRILEAQRADLRQELRAAREVTGRLPETDMVEPGDEVTDLAELHALVERLAIDLAETTKVVTQRLAVVETHLGITDGILPSVRELRRMHEEEKANTAEPTRYRDRDGDTWERVDPFLYVLIVGEEDTPGAIFARPLEYVRDNYGPLTPVTGGGFAEEEDH